MGCARDNTQTLVRTGQGTHCEGGGRLGARRTTRDVLEEAKDPIDLVRPVRGAQVVGLGCSGESAEAVDGRLQLEQEGAHQHVARARRDADVPQQRELGGDLARACERVYACASSAPA